MAFQEAWPKLFLISVTRSIFFCGSNKGEKKPCHQKITFSKKNCFKNCAPAISISVIALWSQILKKKMYSLSTRLTSEFSIQPARLNCLSFSPSLSLSLSPSRFLPLSHNLHFSAIGKYWDGVFWNRLVWEPEKNQGQKLSFVFGFPRLQCGTSLICVNVSATTKRVLTWSISYYYLVRKVWFSTFSRLFIPNKMN